MYIAIIVKLKSNGVLYYVFCVFSECPNPAFNPTFTLMDPADLLFPLDVEKTITCETGYYFAQQEHLDELSVTMTCQAGHWDVNRYPHCLRKSQDLMVFFALYNLQDST